MWTMLAKSKMKQTTDRSIYKIECSKRTLEYLEDQNISILKNGKRKEAKPAELKRGDLIEVTENGCTVPYKQLGFFWKYLEKFPQNQVRPRKYFRPKIRFVKTRYSRVYMNLSPGTINRYVLWFGENVDRGLYNVSALKILYRLKDIANTHWDEVQSVEIL